MKHITSPATPAVKNFQNIIQKIRKCYTVADRNTSARKKEAQKLLNQSQALHMEMLRDFNQRKHFNRVKEAQACGLMAVKAISVDIKDSKEKNLEFIFNQILNSKKNRPVKTLKPAVSKKVDRNRVFRSDTLSVEERKISQTRGSNKDTPFSKPTSYTLSHCPSLTHTFNYPFSVMLMIDLRYTVLKPYNIYAGNMATNQKWNVKNTASWDQVMANKEGHRASTLEDISQTQIENISSGQISPQNEILPRVSTAAVTGILAVAKLPDLKSTTGYVYAETEVADRLNALYANYVFRQLAHNTPAYKNFLNLWKNFPTYILDPNSVEMLEYTIPQQIADLKVALSRQDNTVAHIRLKKLREDIVDKEIYSPAIKFFLDMHDSSAAAKSSVLNLANILAAWRDGFPKAEFTQPQLEKLIQHVGTDEEKLTHLQDHQNLRELVYKISQDKLLAVIKKPEFDDEQRQRILTAAISNSQLTWVAPILAEIQNEQFCFKIFEQFKSHYHLGSSLLNLMKQKGGVLLHKLWQDPTDFLAIFKIFINLINQKQEELVQMMALYLFDFSAAPSNMINGVQLLASSSLSQRDQDNLMKAFLSGPAKPANLLLFFKNMVSQVTNIEDCGPSTFNLLSHINSSGPESVDRHQVANLICSLIDKIANIDTVLAVITSMESAGNRPRWRFVQERQSLVRINSYRYTCHGEEVSEPWIKIISHAQDRVLHLAKRNSQYLHKEDAVVKFLNKPTWKTGVFDGFFRTESKVKQYERIFTHLAGTTLIPART